MGGGYKAVAASRSCTMQMNRDKIEVCSPVSGKWKEYLQTTMGATLSCSGLIADPAYVHSLEKVIADGQPIRFAFNMGGSCTNLGRCVIDSDSVSGDLGSLAGMSCQMTVTGAVDHSHSILANQAVQVINGVIIDHANSKFVRGEGSMSAITFTLPVNTTAYMTLGPGYFLIEGELPADTSSALNGNVGAPNYGTFRLLGWTPKTDSAPGLTAGTYTVLYNTLSTAQVRYGYTL